MTTIEERVVAMKFQGEQFLAGIDKSLAKLDQFNAKIKATEGANKGGFEGIGKAAGNQNAALSRLADGVSHISDRFKALGVIGVTALSNITNQAIFAGQNLVKSLSVAPIMDGFHEYETNMNSIQTILSNTQAAGTKLQDVTDALDELNIYSDQTIYNFSEMAKNIGTFTAAGVGLKEATMSIKGIANLAALSGSNSEQASGAMYQLSQAISAGRVSLEDWNSVVNAGMGGTVFQRALAQNAQKIGTLSKGAVKLKGDMKNVTIEGKSFRESITAKPGQESWLTSKVLTQTLAQFTGDLSDAALAAQGFDKAQIKAIQSQAKMAKNAATQVKTLSQLLGTIKESVGSGWSSTWKLIFGDFPEAKTLFTNVNNVLGGFVTASANARNKVIGDWKTMGGRTAIIGAIANTFKALIAFIKPFKDAFREIFPATTGKQLADISKSIQGFTKGLTISGKTANNIKRTFAGFFAILDIGWTILKRVVTLIFNLISVATEGTGGFLNFTGSVGDFFVALDKSIKSGKGIYHVFNTLFNILSKPIVLIKQLAGYLGSLFDGFNSKEALKNVSEFTAKLSPLGKLGAVLAAVWGRTTVIFKNIAKSMQGVSDVAKKVFGNLGKIISSGFDGFNLGDLFAGINTGLFATLLLFIKKLTGGGGLGGIMESISEGFENLTGALGAMQNTLRAATLLQIAAAVGILAIAMNVLSKIDAAGLARASGAITVMFTQLLGSLLLFEKFSGFVGFAKMPFVAASLILMAIAVNILARAMTTLSKLDWQGLAKGLLGTTALLGAMVGVTKLIKNPAGLIATAAGMVILAVAVKILVSAVSDLAGLDWQELAKGLIGVGVILGALTLFSKFSAADKGGLAQGAGLLLLAVGIKILASAMGDLGDLSWGEIAKGLVALAGSLVIITTAIDAIPPTAVAAAAGVLIVALSLGKIADALQDMATMSWGEIGKSLVVMLGAMSIIATALDVIPPTAPLGAAAVLIVALSLGQIGQALADFAAFSWGDILKATVTLGLTLGIIAIAMAAMSTALPGAAALLVVAAALTIFTPVLQTLGGLDWGTILTGLGALALTFTVLGVAAALLTPVIPSLLGLAAAIVLLGAGIALTGAGLFLLSTGLTLLAASGVAAAVAFVKMLDVISQAIPQIVAVIGKLLVALSDMIIHAAPKIGQAFMAVMNTLLDILIKLSPKLIDTLLSILTKLVGALNKYVPRMADSAARLVTALINGFAKRIGGVVTAATNLIVAFINAIGKNAPRIQDAGVKLIISLINGVANAIRSNQGAMQAAGRNLAIAIIDGMTGGLASGVGRVISAAKNIASSAINAAKNVLDVNSPSKEFIKIGKSVNEGFVKGLDGDKKSIDAAFATLRSQVGDLARGAMEDIDRLETKLEKLKKNPKKNAKEIKKTEADITQAYKERTRAMNVMFLMTTKLKKQQAELGNLANKYDVVTNKLKAANDVLANATKTRNDYNAAIREQYGDIASPTGDTTAADYVKDLQKQVQDTKTFANSLQLLRKQGLNDEVYKDLLSTGISALPFVTDLLKGGKSQIAQINSLNKQLDSVAASMGKNTSTALYQAAVNSAAGLVKGLQNQQKAIEAQMDKIADAMVKSIKKKLGIKSPSTVFVEVGKFTAQGLAEGLDKHHELVANSAASIGTKAIDAVRAAMVNADKMIAGSMDVQPVIKPVLDLTDIQKNSGKLGSLMPADMKMKLDGTYSAAASIAAVVTASRAGDTTTAPTAGAVVSYTQINNSPKALSPLDIYRGTKNQLSTVKGALSNK